MKLITFITGNEDKLKEVQHYINIPIVHQKMDLVEIQSLNVYEVVDHKVKEAYKILQKPVLVEDVSFVLPALGNFPGPFIKWFMQELKIEGICELMKNYKNKTAIATVLYGFYDGKKVHFFEGQMKGTIAKSVGGEHSFGFGKIFIPEGSTKRLAEMLPNEQEIFAYRLKALRKFEAFLENYEK